MNETEIEYSGAVRKAARINTGLFPVYKMLSWDLVFFYAVSFLFLTTVKGISASYILFAEAFYTICKVILQIPCTALVDKIGNRNSLIIGNLSVSLHVLVIILSVGFSSLMLSHVFAAVRLGNQVYCRT